MIRIALNAERDARQKLRMTRHLMAVGSSMLVIGLLAVYWHEGHLADIAFYVSSGSIVALIVFFNLLFSTGLNVRFRDPSLTLPQIASSLAVLVYVSFNLQEGRGAFMLVYIMAVLFGVFRLTTRQLLMLVVPVIAAHAAIVSTQVERVDGNLNVELLQWLVLCVVLLWFTQLGGYISAMRIRLNTLATRDELTGCYNRRHMLETLAAEKTRVDRHGGSLTVALIDLDRFKSINDVHGHAGGDIVLQEFSKVVRKLLRESDHFGRYGGEEFIVILPATDATAALRVMDRIRESTRMEVGAGLSQKQVVTISGGVHQYVPGETMDHVIQQADAALYAAKNSGRDRILTAAAPADAEARQRSERPFEIAQAL